MNAERRAQLIKSKSIIGELNISKKKPNTLRGLVEKQLDDMDTAFERMGISICAITLEFWEWELTSKDVLSEGSLLRKDAAIDFITKGYEHAVFVIPPLEELEQTFGCWMVPDFADRAEEGEPDPLVG